MPQFIKRLNGLLIILTVAILSGCQGYAFSVNDQPVYTPAPLINDYAVADEGLNSCVQQTIEDAQITQLEELTELRCSNAGVADLTGLENLTELSKLDLRGNSIVDLAPLQQLKKLKNLYLDSTTAVDCVSLKILSERNVVIEGAEACLTVP